MKCKNVLVVGAGVSGLTTALALLRAGHKVTIWSKERNGDFPTTSLNAYAMWVPVRIESDPRIERWTNESYDKFDGMDIATRRNAGVAMRRIVTLKPTNETPWYADRVPGFRRAHADEIPAGYADAHVIERAPVIDPRKYLPWLRNQITCIGGVFQRKIVSDFSKCGNEFDVIINASGLGARKLASDTGLFPERVQVVTIRPNGFNRVVIDDEGLNKRACIVPHADYIKLGAVFDGQRERLRTSVSATRDIIERCSRLMPGHKVEMSDVVDVARALRPERSLPRVEVERLASGITVVHNYGHDGMGYLLSHGIAADIVRHVAAI